MEPSRVAARVALRLGVAGALLVMAGAAHAEHVAPEFVEGQSGNQTCDDFQGAEDWVELKVDPPAAGTFGDGAAEVTITGFDGKRFDWSSSLPMDAVFVKAGAAGSYLYRYAPEASDDTRLQSPGETGNAISHVSFCYDASGGSGGGGGGGGTTPQQPLLDSQASTNGEVAPGEPVTDTAFVTGADGFPPPTGTVTFYLCGPGEATASGCPAGQQVGAPKELAAGQATSDPASPMDEGRHCWRAAYSGDAVYASAAHTNGDTECFEVARVPTATAVVSVPGGDVGVGAEVHAEATVSAQAGGPVGGSVAFYLCGPGEVTSAGCASGGTQVGAAAGVEAGAAASAAITTAELGRHCWRAEYGGTAVHLGSSGTDGGSACFVVKRSVTILSLSLPGAAAGGSLVADLALVVSGSVGADAAAELAGDLGARVTAALEAEVHVSASALAQAAAGTQGVAAEAAARAMATGTVRFYLCGPAEVTGGGCVTGGTLVGEAKGLVAGAALSDLAASPALPGTYCWRVEYDGDGLHLAARHTNRDTECFVVLGSVEDPARGALARREDLALRGA